MPLLNLTGSNCDQKEPTAPAILAVLEYRKGGTCAAAVSHFAKAGELLDSQVRPLFARIRHLPRMKLKRMDEAITTFQRALALRPEDPRERLVLASIQLMAKKPQDALATLQPLLQAKDVDVDTALPARFDSLRRCGGLLPGAVSTLRQRLFSRSAAERQLACIWILPTFALRTESFQVGIDVITEGLSLQPKSDDLYVARGFIRADWRSTTRPRADFTEQAYRIEPQPVFEDTAAQGLAAVQAK